MTDMTAPVTGTAYLGLCVAAAVVGLITSIGVWLFLQGFGLINRLMLGGLGAAPAPFGTVATVLIPALGGLIVALFMHFLSRPDKLTGMAHVIDGVAEHEGRLNYRNGAIFVLGSMLGIGFGAPVGADTPAAMIGGHFGTWLAQRLRWPSEFIRVLVVAGVGAGISATFFAQLAAVFFALEVLLGGFGGALFVVPTLIAVVVSGLFTFSLGGKPVQYNVSASQGHWGAEFVLYIGVALLAALAAIVYVNLLPFLKNLWLKVSLPFWARTAVAGLIVGVIGIWLPGVFGTGLSQMKSIFDGTVYPFGLLIALLIAKIILTPGSLGAGFVGGVIGPALLIGSALGAAYGDVVAKLFPGVHLSPVAFAMVATTAMLAGTFHAPIFGAMMIFQMNSGYGMLLPLLLAAAIGYSVARRFQPGSAYTFMFQEFGIHLQPGTFTAVSKPDEGRGDEKQ
jgi:CIC family chloride channel protein